jgi:hypothetical protein
MKLKTNRSCIKGLRKIRNRKMRNKEVKTTHDKLGLKDKIEEKNVKTLQKGQEKKIEIKRVRTKSKGKTN